MITNPQCPEGRQHISLSNYAFSVVRNDSQTFMGVVNYSGFINKIVLNSMLESFDDLAFAENERISNELSRYSKIGRSMQLTKSDQEMIDKIANAHRNYQIASFARYPKDVSLKIRLNKDLHKILYPLHSDWSGIRYNISQGDYIKSLVEDYSRKTIYDRESIYFKSVIEDIEVILKADNDGKKRAKITLSNGARYDFKPYRLSYDYEANYHYLIGMVADEGLKDYKPVSYRISNIAKISPRSISTGSGKITKDEKEKIEQQIKECSVAYIVGTPEEHIVKLTPKGMELYNSIFHQRPVYKEPPKNDGDTFLLTFFATSRQITNYFFTFADEAEIISPEETRNWMKNRYKSAYDSYDNSL